MKRYITSPSAAISTASAILCASPAYLTAIGLAVGTGASALATWFSGSSIATGSALWTLEVSASQSVNLSFNAPILAACQLGVNVIGGCAMTAWDR